MTRRTDERAVYRTWHTALLCALLFSVLSPVVAEAHAGGVQPAARTGGVRPPVSPRVRVPSATGSAHIQPTTGGFAPVAPSGRPAATATIQPTIESGANEPAQTVTTNTVAGTATAAPGEEEVTTNEPANPSVSTTLPVAGLVVMLVLIGGALLAVGGIAGLCAWIQRLHRHRVPGSAGTRNTLSCGCGRDGREGRVKPRPYTL